MRKTVFTALLSLCLTAIGGLAEQVVLTADSNVRVVEVGDFGNAGGRLSELLGKYLLLALGKDRLQGGGNPVDFVIKARAKTWREIPRDHLRQLEDIDAFDIEVIDGKPAVVRITGATTLAAGFGVMHFLEQYLGIMWLFPGELGLSIPDREAIRLSVGREGVAPEFVSRLCTGFVYRDRTIPGKRFVYEGLLHERRMFFYSHDYFKSLKLNSLASPSHNMIHIFPLSTREDHPELLPVKDGERWVPPDKDSPKGKVGWWQAWHPCYSNPETVEIAVQKGRETFAKGAFCFSLGINDGRRVQCECEECTRIGWPNSYYDFVSRVAEGLKDYYPPRLVGVIAYGDVKYPPENLDLPENVVVICASGGSYRHVTWSEHAELLGTYEWAHGQGYWAPNLPMAGIKSNARFYHERGIQFYRSEIHPLWAFDGPRVYLRLRLLWDRDFDLEAGLARYCRAAFGPAAEDMTRLYRYWAAKRDGDVIADGVTPMHAKAWPRSSWRDPEVQFAACTRDDFEFSAQQFEAAKARNPEGKAAERLAMAETFFADGSTLFAMRELKSRLFDADRPVPWKESFAEAALLQAQRRAHLETMRDHPEWFVGTSASVGDDLRPSWEERGAMSCPQELENALLTTVVTRDAGSAPWSDAGFELPARLARFAGTGQRAPEKLHPRKEHAWYPDWGYVPLVTSGSGPVVEFRTEGADARITEHPTLKGDRKVHWLAAVVVGVPMSERHAYLFELDTHGRKGRIDARVDWGSRGKRGAPARFLEDYGPESRTLRRHAAFVPGNFEPDEENADADVSGEMKGNLNIYITWQPLSDESPLEGSCRFTRLEL